MENTSYISEISYKVEVWLYQGYSIKSIDKEIKELQGEGMFPKNLKLIDAYLDKSYGSSGCAFLDTNTGETIIGFAGTNDRNGTKEFVKDIITDAGLAFSQNSPNSAYMYEANKFINDLKEKGYNIAQSTGHSLGGALSVYAGINHNIPLVATYNGAPLYVLPTKDGIGNIFLIKDKVKKYNGKVTRFVTERDLLNSAADFANGFYIGEEVMFYNGLGHGIEFFKGKEEQENISKVLLYKMKELDGPIVLSVDFNGDEKVDLSLSTEDLFVKNLFGQGGLYSGNGTTIKITPSAFTFLKDNLEGKMAADEISWIKRAIKLCKTKNESIKQDRSTREDNLSEGIIEGLNNAGLNKLITQINNSHGNLVKNKNILEQLSVFNMYNITRKFDRWGSSGGRKWFLDGTEFDEYEIINYIEDLQQSANILHHQITATGEFTYYTRGSSELQVYKFDIISEIAQAFVNITNGFLSKAKEAFKGTGLRSGKNDGIVNSISEVLEIEEKNVIEIENKIISIAKMAQGVADNFTSADKWLSKSIENGNMTGEYNISNIANNYKAYLEENHIFDDVKDVIEAYDLQVEEAANTFSENIISDFTDLINRAHTVLRKMSTAIEDFKYSIVKIKSVMDKNITSTYIKVISTGYNEWETEEIKNYHGTIAEIFPSYIVANINSSEEKIIPIIDSIYSDINVIELYNLGIYNMREYFNSI